MKTKINSEFFFASPALARIRRFDGDEITVTAVILGMKIQIYSGLLDFAGRSLSNGKHHLHKQ